MTSGATIRDVPVIPLAHQELDGFRAQAAVFEDIFLVFLILGTLVGIVVIGYMIYNAYKYREGAADPVEEFDAPTVGELPTGGAGGRKLFVSFAISAIIVIGLVAWTYTALLYVEQGATEEIETEYDVAIEGIQFGWETTYPNNETTFNEVYLPVDTMVGLEVTSPDVWHTFGVTDLRIKVDAIPGQVSETWVLVEEEGQHRAECFELCGIGHSAMDADVYIIDREEWESQFVDDPEDGEETDAMQIKDDLLNDDVSQPEGAAGVDELSHDVHPHDGVVV